MGMLDDLGISDATVYPALNTGTSLDIATGIYEKGSDGKYYLNGGVPPMLGVAGRSGNYKSTTMEGLMVFGLHNYPHSEAYKLDSESNALSPKARMYKTIACNYGPDYDADSIMNRVVVDNISNTSSEDVEEKIRQICKYKDEHRKELTIVTPFVSPKGEPIKMLIPTFICMDSLSAYRFSTTLDKESNLSVEDKQRNMDDMQDGKWKKSLLNSWTRLSYKYGLYFLMSAQVGENQSMDMYSMPEKQGQFSKQNDRFKNVSNQFTYLTNTLIQNYSPKPITRSSDKKEPEYIIDGVGAVEINELTTKLLRCKTSAAGVYLPMVASQTHGVLNGLTYFHYLRENKDFGYITSGVGKTTRCPILTPEIKLTRQNVTEMLKNSYELNRALEILFQLKWILQYWSTATLPFDVPKTAEEFMDRIAKGGDLTVSDIINSRGYWTYEDPDKRPYMSIFDILSILDVKQTA